MFESVSALLNGRKGATYRLLFLVAIGVCGGLPHHSANAAEYLTGDEAMALAFGSDVRFERKNTIVPDEDRAALAKTLGKRRISRFFEYYEVRQDDRSIGYAVVDDVKGKHLMIDYMIAFNGDHSVRAVEVLAYRESYGDEIRQSGFRNQFVGRKPGEPLRLNREIVNISGATISCRSMIEAVGEKLAFVHALLPRCAETERGASVDLDQPTEETTIRRRSRMLMGTVLEIEVRGLASAEADNAINAAFAEVERIESLISSWRPDSEISRINRASVGELVEIDLEAWSLLDRCREYHALTQGRFDVTVGPLIDVWRRAERTGLMPKSGSVAEARGRIGMDRLDLPQEARVQASIGDLRIDLGGVGKGYAMDRAAAVLRDSGADVALLNFGGQLLALDPPAGMDGWPTLISEGTSDWRMVFLANESLATSGDSERFIEIEGRRHSHIIDPVAGAPSSGRVMTSVIARSAELADVWATALFLLGEEGLKDGQADLVDALVVEEDGTTFSGRKRFQVVDGLASLGGR